MYGNDMFIKVVNTNITANRREREDKHYMPTVWYDRG